MPATSQTTSKAQETARQNEKNDKNAGKTASMGNGTDDSANAPAGGTEDETKTKTEKKSKKEKKDKKAKKEVKDEDRMKVPTATATQDLQKHNTAAGGEGPPKDTEQEAPCGIKREMEPLDVDKNKKAKGAEKTSRKAVTGTGESPEKKKLRPQPEDERSGSELEDRLYSCEWSLGPALMFQHTTIDMHPLLSK